MGMARVADLRPGRAHAAPGKRSGALAHVPGGLMHTALCHRTTKDMASTLVPFVHDALVLNDPVYVSLPPAGTSTLKAALGRDADRVRWSDSTRWHPHPTGRLRGTRELVDAVERHGVGRVRLIGECPLPPVPPMIVEWERFDALLNDVLAGMPATVVCIYDESRLAPEVVARAPWSHPFLGLDPPRPSASYLEPAAYLTRHRVPAVPVPAGAPTCSGRVGPAEARAFVREAIGAAGGAQPAVPPGVVEDMALAVTELVTNSWQAAARSVAVTCWRVEGEIGARVDDDGAGLDDVLAGYRWPDPGAEGGRGLWMARQLVDILDVCSTQSGTSVRVRTFDDVRAFRG